MYRSPWDFYSLADRVTLPNAFTFQQVPHCISQPRSEIQVLCFEFRRLSPAVLARLCCW